jgi:hypothetical protein
MPYLAPTGPKSVKATLEDGPLTDPAGDRVADWVVVRGIESVGSYEIGGARLIGAVLICEVSTG